MSILPCDTLTQSNWVTLGPCERHPRGRGNISNLTTKPVSLLLLPQRQLTRSLTEVSCCDSRKKRSALSCSGRRVAALEPRLRSIHDPPDEDLCVLTCLWKVAHPGESTASHGASSWDTEELPSPAGETGGWGQGGTEWLCWGVYSESSFVFFEVSNGCQLWQKEQLFLLKITIQLLSLYPDFTGTLSKKFPRLPDFYERHQFREVPDVVTASTPL